MTKKEINDRIENKVYSKLNSLTRDILDLERSILQGGDGRLSKDLLMVSLESTKREYEVWSYIRTLNEKDY